MKNRKTKSRSGFTLIEMMAVISIILLVYALAGPAISRFMKRNSLRMAVEQTQKMIGRARQIAITTAGFYAVQINATMEMIGIYDASATDSVDSSDLVDKLWKAPRGIDIAIQGSGADNRVTTSGSNAVINLIFNANGAMHNGTNEISYVKLTDTNAAATTDRSHTVRVYRTTGVTRVVESADF